MEVELSKITNELHSLIDAYRVSEAPTDAMALGDFLIRLISRPYLVEDRSDHMVYTWETAQEAQEYANVLIEAQGQSAGEAPFGVNHKTRKLMVVDEQNWWQPRVK